MPREILSFAPENITGVEVSGFWRLHLGPAPVAGKVGIGLLFYKYMGPGSTPTALAKLPVGFVSSQNTGEAQRSIQLVADKCICMNDPDADKQRSAEAWQMFRNSGASERDVEAVVDNVAELIEAYWKLRQWAEGGFGGRLEVSVPAAQTRLVAIGDAAEPEPFQPIRATRPAGSGPPASKPPTTAAKPPPTTMPDMPAGEET